VGVMVLWFFLLVGEEFLLLGELALRVVVVGRG